jgi:hypothetical protein
MVVAKWSTRGEVVATLTRWLETRPEWGDAEQRALALAIEIASRDELDAIRRRMSGRASRSVAARLRLACAMRHVQLSDAELREELSSTVRDLDRGLSAQMRRWDGIAGRACVLLLARLGPATLREVLSAELAGRDARFYRSLLLTQQTRCPEDVDLGAALRGLAGAQEAPPPKGSRTAKRTKRRELTGRRAELADAAARAEHGDEGGVADLMELARSSAHHIRSGALRSLVRVGAGFEVFRDYARSSEDYHEVRLSLHGLSRSSEPADLDLLVDCLLNRPDGTTHLACIATLAGVYALDPDTYVDTIDETYRGGSALL